MKRKSGVLVGIAMAMATLAGPAAAVAAAPDEPDRTELQRRLDDVVDVGAVGALAEVRDARGVWQSTSGVAERDKTRAVPVGARFRIGSTTKTFVATVVLQLVGEGRLGLDDPVTKWLPGVVPNGQHITVRHLLSHTSGLYDYLRTLPLPPKPEFLENRTRTWTAAEMIERAVANPPVFEPPGDRFSYSNTNYTLLGQIVERVTGRSYAGLVEDRVLRPLGLHETYLPGTSERIRGPHPHGYVPIRMDGTMQLVDYTEMNPSVMGAGGEMISTTHDLNRFFAALLSGHLLPAHLLEEMKTPGIEGGRYGLGMFTMEMSCGIRVFGHDGDALSYHSWSYQTEDLSRQVSIALTPDFLRGDAEEPVEAFLDEVFCG